MRGGSLGGTCGTANLRDECGAYVHTESAEGVRVSAKVFRCKMRATQVHADAREAYE